MDNPLIRSSLSLHGPFFLIVVKLPDIFFCITTSDPKNRPHHHQPRIIYQSYPQMFHGEALYLMLEPTQFHP